MPKYAITGEEGAVTSSLTTAMSHTRGASRRHRLYDIAMGATGTPADNVLRYTLMRHTAPPTVTAVTPLPLDPADPASVTTAGDDATNEGTVTAASELIDIGLNQRATYRWVAAPGGEIVVPDTSNNGLSHRVLSPAYTGVFKVTGHIEE